MTFFKITLGCLLAIGLYNFLDTTVDLYLSGEVYACTSDRGKMPPQIEQQCKRLTRGQWWAK